MTLKQTLLMMTGSAMILASASSLSENRNINMQEGRWEITTKMEMANMPFAIPPMTQTMCLTKDNLIPQQDNQEGEQGNCDISQKINGNTVSWTVDCNAAEGNVTTTGTITYHGDRFDGIITINTPGDGGSMKQIMTGRRIGDCN